MNKTVLSFAHPIIKEWFTQKLGKPTQPQSEGWQAINAGEPTLISAPTGSGKTLAAFLACIDKLFKKSLTNTLEDKLETLYISPLKALSNDIQKNLNEPLSEILSLARAEGHIPQPINVLVRTGDTKTSDRQKMLKRPPHILITTPESLYILLTSEKSREILKEIKTVIVDEIHALVNNKRGTHLTLSLERLDAITKQKPIRIGLSATQKPINLVANFLVGSNGQKPKIIDTGHRRALELSIELPKGELTAIASNEMWDEIYDKIAHLSQTHRSILVFVNTRRLAERLAHHLSERLGPEKVAAHHGSLAKNIRHAAEVKLKNGELSIIVATASLELGIDIGTVDLVCQIGSPRAISIALQRIGRSGHTQGAISKGMFFATTRDELFECAALIYAIKNGDLDELIFPQEPLDILAQQIIACASTNDWHEDELYFLVKNAYPYAHLSRDTFDSVIELLSEGVSGSRGRYGAYLFRDKVNSLIKAKRGARLTAITSGGAIPENGLFTVIAEPDNVNIGTLDEDFAVESNRGDIILLGTTSWKINRIEGVTGKVFVENAHGAPPSVPFWRGEANGRTKELSSAVSTLREILDQKLTRSLEKHSTASSSSFSLSLSNDKKEWGDFDDIIECSEMVDWLEKNCAMNADSSKQMITYFLQGRAMLGGVPTQKNIIAERFFDESGGMQLVIHAPFGMRINKAWGLALRKRFCTSFNFELQAAATDNGLNISLLEQHSFPLNDVFKFVQMDTLQEVLTQAILQSPLFTTRWRWTATRSLALKRFQRGRKVPPNIQRMLSDDLLAAVFPDAAACQDNIGDRIIEPPNHPLINETMKDVFHEALDLNGFKILMKDIKHGTIRQSAIDTAMPSVFSAEIINANPYAFLDDAPLEERRSRAVSMRRVLPETLLQEAGKLDPKAIQEVQEQAWPDIRNCDEMHDFLQTCIALPAHLHFLNLQRNTENWESYCTELILQERVALVTFNQQKFWVASEKKKTFQTIYSRAMFNSELKDLDNKSLSYEEAVESMIKGWIFYLGPTSNEEIGQILHIKLNIVDQALLKLENSGQILRGKFVYNEANSKTNINEDIIKKNNENETANNQSIVLQWCERRLLARIHRLTIEHLRREIEPVKPKDFYHWLLKWQHVADGTQLAGERGLLEVIRKLQGFEIAANAWEKHIFSKRISDYSGDMLDKLCLNGTVGWCRLSKQSSSQKLELSTELETKLKGEFKSELNSELNTTLISELKLFAKKRIHPTSNTPITFFIREEQDWILEQVPDLNRMSPIASIVYEYLKKRGASFFTDLIRETKHLSSELERALWELVSLGLITADSFDNLRSIIDPKRRLKHKHSRSMFRGYCAGRWSLFQTLENTINQDKTKNYEAICWLLLKRYGIVFRDLLIRERNIPFWHELLITFRTLEQRGEIRGGRFVSGFRGEQFALPAVIESLRTIKHEEETQEGINISAVDPLNLAGIILPGERIPALSQKKITFKSGSFITN